MSKQTFLDSFLNKKNKHQYSKASDRVKRKESRENSQDTVRLEDESEVKLEVFQPINKKVCPSFILIGPQHVRHFPTIKSKLEKLQAIYSRDDVIAFIEGNLRFHKIDNVRHLESIKDDDFWSFTVIKLIRLLIDELSKPQHIFKIFHAGSTEVATLSRLNILVLLGSMFMGIMPKQMHEEQVSFGELMILRQNEYNPQKALGRLQKLKCIIAYFNIMIRNEHIYKEEITIQRTSCKDVSYLETSNFDRENPLRSVQFQHLENRTIQSFYGSAIMVDFANKKLGGGVLRNGCVQEEILFAIFPQLIAAKLLCEQMEDDEAIIIYRARRFARYSGYADSFKCEGQFALQRDELVQESVFVAIDAVDFCRCPTEGYQYSKRGVRRQINKAFCGFQGACFEARESLPICTGKWGCGVFNGDQDLKFLIQWIASSQAGREMIYITDSKYKIQQYSHLVQQLQMNCTMDVLSLIDEYGKQRQKGAHKGSILDYIKYHS